MRKILIALALSALAATVYAAEPDNEITNANVVALMNAYRAEAGLPALHEDATLDAVAADRMRDMEDGGWWSHESPEGKSPFVWLATRAYDYDYAGENLAAGFETARLLVSSWMESPGHRENILGVQYHDVGVAIIDGSTKGRATGKSIVVMFGRRRDAPVITVTRR
jgi:uncharacterized protein YkwD